MELDLSAVVYVTIAVILLIKFFVGSCSTCN